MALFFLCCFLIDLPSTGPLCRSFAVAPSSLAGIRPIPGLTHRLRVRDCNYVSSGFEDDMSHGARYLSTVGE